MWKPHHFPSNDQAWMPGVLWQTLRLAQDIYGLKMGALGTIDEPQIRLTVFSSRALKPRVFSKIVREVTRRYDLDSTAIAEFVQRYSTDKILGHVIERWRGMRPKSGYSLYEYLVITVMLQNTVVKRSVAMLHSLFEHYGRLAEFDEHELWAFWEAKAIERTSEKELRALRVGYRAKILKRQANQLVRRHIDEGRLWGLGRTERLKELDKIYGVGPQSAGYMLYEFFHDYDALEHIPPWEGKIYSRILFGHDRASPERIMEFVGRRFPGFRHLALDYLITDLFWRHREQNIDWLAKLIRR